MLLDHKQPLMTTQKLLFQKNIKCSIAISYDMIFISNCFPQETSFNTYQFDPWSGMASI